MCGRLCLVIRTVNDRDAWGDAEKELWEGSVRARWYRGGELQI